MTNSEWTIGAELSQLAKMEGEAAALASLGLLSSGSTSYALEEVSGWARSGSETYSYVFRIGEPDRTPLTCRLKACVAFSAGGDVESILASWLRRRSLLAEAGVSTPRLWAAGRGVLLEEEILGDVPAALERDSRAAVLAALLDMATALARLRFNPQSAFSDVRTRGSDAVFIDFGSDLGEPGNSAASPERIFAQLETQLIRWQVNLSTEEATLLHESFQARINSVIQ